MDNQEDIFETEEIIEEEDNTSIEEELFTLEQVNNLINEACAVKVQIVEEQQYNKGFDNGYLASAREPKAWELLDSQGTPVRMGDYIHCELDPKDINIKVIGFTSTHFIGIDHKFYNVDYCIKVDTDTESYIIEEMVNSGVSAEQAEEWVSRLVELN